MTRDTYKRAFANVNVSEECVKEVLSLSMNHSKRMRRNGGVKLIIPCVAVMMALSAVTVAAYGLGFTELFKGYFESNSGSSTARGLSPNQLQQIDKAGTELVASALSNGTAVNVKAAVGDKNAAYILLDVVAPEGTALNKEDYLFGISHIDFNRTAADDEKHPNLGWGIKTLKDDNTSDNKKSFVIDLQAANVDLTGKELTLSLENLALDKGKELETVLSGQWKLKFKLAYDTTTKEYTVNKLVNFDGVNTTVAKVSISSISASVTFEGGTAKTSEPGHEEKTFYRTPSLNISFKDGTTTTVTRGLSSNTDKGGLKNYRFDAPIDLTAVKSITLGDLEIPIQ